MLRDRFATTAVFMTVAAVSGAFAPFAWAQGGPGATPLAVDLTKVPVGSWAEYQVKMGEQKGKTRWALVDRSAGKVAMEMSMEQGPLAAFGSKMTMRLLLPPDPTKAAQPLLEAVMQIEGKDPMLMPPGMPPQRFERPDPRRLVGKETIKVAAGSFPTKHYRRTDERGTLDMWLSEELPPIGLVKLALTPAAGSPMPPIEVQLASKGKDQKPTITKKPVPFDPSKLGLPPGAGPAPGGAPPPPPAKPAH